MNRPRRQGHNAAIADLRKWRAQGCPDVLYGALTDWPSLGGGRHLSPCVREWIVGYSHGLASRRRRPRLLALVHPVSRTLFGTEVEADLTGYPEVLAWGLYWVRRSDLSTEAWRLVCAADRMRRARNLPTAE
jgi:hypothetical protein